MRTYLDHAATSPVRPEVAEQLTQDLRDGLPGANPSALHAAGRRAGALLSEARARLATALGVHPHEVIFTSGGTEAATLVVIGRALAGRAESAGLTSQANHTRPENQAGRRKQPGQPRPSSQASPPALVVSPIEHPAVLDSARVAQAELGVQLRLLEVDADGLVVTTSLEQALASGGVALVSLMAANNETGVVQDLAGLVAQLRALSGQSTPGRPGYVPVHSDVVAALGRMPVDFHGWGLDAMSLSGHKLGAPVGIGALVARRDLVLRAPSGGGRQERALRSGTQDVLGARALALAVELALAERQAESVRLTALRERLITGVLALPGAHATVRKAVAQLPSTAHFWFDDADGEALLMALDLAGVDASAGSACHAGVSRPSHVLLAMGLGEAAARATLRCSFGPTTSLADVERLLAILPRALETARKLR
ncbi:Cysteine desulfurase [Actinomyces bovis]|uniref:cysteine desulfurase n=1 Tax=Actinomyces bovis TaxID=1658 RepID=A0ABY1VM55_9ACTO|nr:cysteine desulfurase family protein [Actinomyces bovis]SPT52761.1 Cysteine desulfurase [Actinomyces bovis]VEG54767.1 Cysteine desulfurase [Actinomyces israelii]